MKPSLFVLAAGMGSRYGGLKQLDGLGPNGETIMDYSIFDAMRSGFGKVVFVIRRCFEQDFREKVVGRYENHTKVEVVFQELDCLPDGFSVPAGRVKPWGTNHAVLMGRDVINEPFAVVNADDFYGRRSFGELARYLALMEGGRDHYCMVGYRLGNTLSESGSVARGVCEKDGDGFLTAVVERSYVIRSGDGTIKFRDENDELQAVGEDTPVSMNMWGFTPEYFDYAGRQFVDFLKNNADNPKSEFFIPIVINNLVKDGKARVKVLDTPSQWFGVTYREDRPNVVLKLRELHDTGEYPSKLF
ncbi:MAG: nucleotidyltransferase [Dysgonamonadaceae bacterium]|jgi:dTDP-glucose pyrophosphorylase|nr:nucleotidyltransferase [Dysgonamonadaceae bacterium]